MRRLATLITGTILCTVLWAWQAKDDKAAVALQAAIKKEAVDGDLKGAIEQYKKIAQSRDRTVAAKALVRMGECYEKLGDGEARKAFERVVREFGDQKEQARDAEGRLAAMEQKAGRSRGLESALVLKASRLGTFGGVTPDGRLSPFIDPETGDIAVMDLRSNTPKRLTNDARVTAVTEKYTSLVLSRDGRKIACIFRQAAQSPPREELRIVNVDNGGMQTVKPKENIGGWWDVRDWSPGGNSVLLTVQDNVNRWSGFLIVDTNTGEVRRIQNPNVEDYVDAAAFSRDGRWIVFSNGYYKRPEWDIQAQEVSTGKINPLVSGGGANHKIALMPDRDVILFRSDRSGKNAIWSVKFQDGRTTGPPELIKADSGDYDPVGLSRDGTLFYSLRHESSDIYQAILNPETLRVEGQPVRLVNSSLGRNKSAVWSPSGKSFAYYTERDGEAHVVIRQEHKEVMLTETAPYDREPFWCGEDSLLVYGIPNFYTIRLFDAATGKVRGTDHVFKFDFPRTISAYTMAPSPDCSKMYIYNQLAATKQRRIYQYDMSTREEKDLVRDSGDWTDYYSPSPDGRWLISSGRLPEGRSRGLLILPTSGGPFRMLDTMDDPEFDWGYAWAPDSRRILSPRRLKGPDGQPKDPELYWIPIEGGQPQPVGIQLTAENPVVSLNADGRRLLYSSGERRSELWALRNLPLK
jgi:Tol biopolymer transport system component